MNNEPKCFPNHSELLGSPLKHQNMHLLRSKTHSFNSQIKNVCSPYSPRRYHSKMCQPTDNKIKNTNFSSCLFNNAHKIDPARQTYLPTRIQTPKNTTKIRKMLIQHQKLYGILKTNKISKTKSLNRCNSKQSALATKYKAADSAQPPLIPPLSSLTFLILNQCKLQTQNRKETGKTISINKQPTTDNNSTKWINTLQSRQPHYDNPYELLPLRKSKRRMESGMR